MYCSLDRIDLVLDAGDHRIAWQTDHRDADVIEQEPDLSRVFLASRVRNALLWNQADVVRVLFEHTPPAFLVGFARRCGAEVQVGLRGAPLPPAPDDVRAEVEASWLRVGRALLDEYGQPVTLDGLVHVERSLRAATKGGPDTELDIEYWTNTLRLGGAAAVVMQAMVGGCLYEDEEVERGLCYRWSHDDGLTNLFRCAAAFLDDEPGLAPSTLVRTVMEIAEEGDVMLSLRPPDWPGVDVALTLPILPYTEKSKSVELPILAVVTDLPTATKTLPRDAPDVAGLRAQAIANSRKHAVRVESVQRPDGTILVVHGHDYAPERLLDVDFVRSLSAPLGAVPLLASVPCRGVLLVRGPGDLEATSALLAITRLEYDDAHTRDRLSKEVFLLSDGAVVGVALAGADGGRR
jgi:hypothetical protein